MHSVFLRNNVNTPGLKFSKAAQDLRHQRVRVFKAIRFCSQDDDSKSEAGELLLVRQAPIHREEDVVVGGSADEAQEFSVFDARPTGARNRLDVVAG